MIIIYTVYIMDLQTKKKQNIKIKKKIYTDKNDRQKSKSNDSLKSILSVCSINSLESIELEVDIKKKLKK